MFPGSLHQPLATILLVGGLLTCFLGYRLFRFVLAGFGLFFGAIGVVWMIGSTDLWVLVVAVLVGALVGGLMFFAVYYIGVAIVGANALPATPREREEDASEKRERNNNKKAQTSFHVV